MNANTPSEEALGLLLQSSDDQLYEELGIRAKAIANNAAVAGSFEPTVTY